MTTEELDRLHEPGMLNSDLAIGMLLIDAYQGQYSEISGQPLSKPQKFSYRCAGQPMAVTLLYWASAHMPPKSRGYPDHPPFSRYGNPRTPTFWAQDSGLQSHI